MSSAPISGPAPVDAFKPAPARAGVVITSVGAPCSPAVNVLCNWMGVSIEIGAALLVTPLLLLKLGDATYSLWIMIGSIVGFIGMLDLGLRGAVGRFVAQYNAQGDRSAIRCVLSTAGVALSLAGVAALGAVLIAAWATPYVYSIAPEEVGSVRLATSIAGIQLALFLVLRMFDAALWAYQRFDLLNLIDIPTSLTRAGLTAWCVAENGGGLVSLALISLGSTAGSGVAKCWLTYRATPGLSIHPRHATCGMLRQLVAYGFWNFAVGLALLARTLLAPLLVGTLIGVKAVAPLSIVMRLPATAITILAAASGVFTPIAVIIHTGDDTARRQRLLFEGTRLCLSFGLYFLSLSVWLGAPFLAIWIRPDFASYWPLLVIAACGELFPMTMSVASGLLQAMAQHQRLAWLTAGEMVVALAAASVMASIAGLQGFIVALAFAAFLFRGLFVWFHVCHVTGTSSLEFARQTLAAPLLSAAVVCVPLHFLVAAQPPTSWTLLFTYGAMFSVGYACTVAAGVYGLGRTLAAGHVMTNAVSRSRLSYVDSDALVQQ